MQAENKSQINVSSQIGTFSILLILRVYNSKNQIFYMFQKMGFLVFCFYHEKSYQFAFYVQRLRLPRPWAKIW